MNPDVLVVGSGPNGLAAATFVTLPLTWREAKAGLSAPAA